MNYTTCSKCGGELRVGSAIKSNLEVNARYEFYPPPINHETLEIVPVFKCVKCGHSFDNREYI